MPRSITAVATFLVACCIWLTTAPADGQTPRSDDQKEALIRLQQMVAGRQINSAEFRRTLTWVAPIFPLLSLQYDAPQLRWRVMKMNTAGIGFDAFRVVLQGDAAGDLRLAFPKPKTLLAWQIVPPTGTLRPQAFFIEHSLEIPGLDLPSDNEVIFQGTDLGMISPGEEYVVYMQFADDQPVDLSLAIAMVQRPEPGSVMNSKTVARDLGLKMPLQYNLSGFEFQPVRRGSESEDVIENTRQR
ncbi:MAG: hypothetical protein HY000_15450 [Planctomycetes bacterium]|nr:hypothetical protein [Planctomycetota bacterium]